MLGNLRLDNWFAIFVYTGEEDKVKGRLKFKLGHELRFVVPKKYILERKNGKLHEVVRVVFPGYILVQGDITADMYPSFKNIPGLVRLLGDNGLPQKIDPYEMDVIGRLITDNEIIGYSKLLEENGIVRVVDGPMMNLEGTIISMDKRKGRARIRVNLCGNEGTVDLGIEVLEPSIV